MLTLDLPTRLAWASYERRNQAARDAYHEREAHIDDPTHCPWCGRFIRRRVVARPCSSCWAQDGPGGAA